MVRLLGILCAGMAISLVTACSSDKAGAPVPGGTGGSRAEGLPPPPADLCADIGPESIDRLVPGGRPEPKTSDFTLFSESTCSASSPDGTPSGTKRTVWIELNRYGVDKSGRTADQICRQNMRGVKTRDAQDWRHTTSKALPVRLGDASEGQVRSIRWDAEAEILLCRSADFVRVLFKADGMPPQEAGKGAEEMARRILAAIPR